MRASSAARSSGVPVFVFGSPATIASSDAPSAPASAAAEPPPGVGSGEAKASSRSVTDGHEHGLHSKVRRIRSSGYIRVIRLTTTTPFLNTA